MVGIKTVLEDVGCVLALVAQDCKLEVAYHHKPDHGALKKTLLTAQVVLQASLSAWLGTL
jgi:hypothetical protein